MASSTRQAQRLQPRGRVLVGRPVVGLTRFQQAPGDALEHHPLRRTDLPQRQQLLARADAGVGVRQEAGGVEHRAGRRHQVRDRRRVAERVELDPRLRIALLRLVAEREERLAAAGRRTLPRHLHRLVQRHVRPLAGPRRLRERAVVAHVAAELRERDEDLARVADGAAETRVAQCGRPLHEGRKIGLARQIEGGLS